MWIWIDVKSDIDWGGKEYSDYDIFKDGYSNLLEILFDDIAYITW